MAISLVTRDDLVPRVLESLRKRFETGPIDWAPWLAQLKAMKEKAAAEAAASTPTTQ